jgi:glycosyltransferase involved in cell wall biosynthesis
LPGEEDFCIAAVEANSAGRPVIAYAAGGALDTQVDGLTGVLFHPQSVEGLVEAVERADAIDFDPTTIRQHARRFDVKVFRERMMQLVESQVGVKS